MVLLPLSKSMSIMSTVLLKLNSTPTIHKFLHGKHHFRAKMPLVPDTISYYTHTKIFIHIFDKKEKKMKVVFLCFILFSAKIKDLQFFKCHTDSTQ